MAKKIIMGIMAFVILSISGMYVYKEFFVSKEPEEKKVDIYKNAMKKVDIEYLPYGENNSDCLLFITNRNKFQIHVEGTITKEDENGVHNEDKDDEINININPKQTYVLETINPNNKPARINRDEIAFDASSLKASQVDGSNEDGKKSTTILQQDKVEVSFYPDKINDSEQPLIEIKNNSDKKLSVHGYIIFYGNAEKTEVVNTVSLDIEEISKHDTYKNYIYVGNSADKDATGNYSIFINDCE